jgi:hypothetical protein
VDVGAVLHCVRSRLCWCNHGKVPLHESAVVSKTRAVRHATPRDLWTDAGGPEHLADSRAAIGQHLLAGIGQPALAPSSL